MNTNKSADCSDSEASSGFGKCSMDIESVPVINSDDGMISKVLSEREIRSADAIDKCGRQMKQEVRRIGL